MADSKANDIIGMPDDEAALIAFVSERDAVCPGCRYNLRGLERAVCPECQQRLRLTVGALPRPGMLVAAVAPSIFSGLAAFFLSFVTVWQALSGFAPPLGIIILDVFGLLSGLAGVVLVLRQRRFLELKPAVQRRFVFTTWTIHVGATCVLFYLIFL